jgi:hypothetical protein
MKKKVLFIVLLLLFASFPIVGASTISHLNKNQLNEKGNVGRIYGLVETQGHDMLVGVPNIKVACGKNLINFEIEITNEYGFFEFSNLTYEEKGTTYFVWVPLGQRLIFPKLKIVELDDENSEENVYFYVLLWNLVKYNQFMSLSINFLKMPTNKFTF